MTGTIEVVGRHFRWHSHDSTIEDVRTGARRPDSEYNAKVDVYEDRVRHWFLEVAGKLIESGPADGDYAALMIVFSYVEGVEQYRTGDASRGRSQARFVSGMARVFPDVDGDVALRLYREVRCGLFHSGFTEGATLVEHGPVPIELRNGYLFLSPKACVQAVTVDLAGYIAQLRFETGDRQLRDNFERLWDERWTASGTSGTD